MPAFISKYGEWMYRGVVLFCVAAFWVGSSKASYATKEDVAAVLAPVKQELREISSDVASLDKSLAILAEQAKSNLRQDDVLRDLELRLRTLERRP